MKLIGKSLVLLLSGAAISGPCQTPKYSNRLKVTGKDYRLEIVNIPWKRSLAKSIITGDRVQRKFGVNVVPSLIDGRLAWGAPEGTARNCLSKFSVQLGGLKFILPGRLWRNCYDLNLTETSDDDYSIVKLTQGTLTVMLRGGDGGSSYSAEWRISQNGFVTRTIFQDGVTVIEVLHGWATVRR